MDEAQPGGLTISIAPERLDEGAPEERAAFGLLRIVANNRILTEGHDAFIDERRDGPLVSGYYLAEWLVANWWRLRYEPRPSGSRSRDWRMSHSMGEIGEGYVWPNITVESDGFRSVIRSSPSDDSATSFRFHGFPHALIMPWADVEWGTDEFVRRVLALLRKQDVGETNLERLWRDLRIERSDPGLARYRRFEALMGCDPDHADEPAIKARLRDEARLGEEGLDELAAVATGPEEIPSADLIAKAAERDGVGVRLGHAPVATELPAWGSVEAWRIGVEAARQIRRQGGFGVEKLSDAALAGLADTPDRVFSNGATPLAFGFVLKNPDAEAMVLRSPAYTGRRFEFARLLGDHAMRPEERFRPATRATTYRQQAQRAFAAEFLAPIDAVAAMADGDFSTERQADIAHALAVSDMTINSLLKNNHFIPRDNLEFGYTV